MKWVMVITLLLVSSDVFSQVRGTNWGDSWEQVEKTIKDELEDANAMLELVGLNENEISSRLIGRISAQYTNRDTTYVGYLFLDDKLAHIIVNYQNPEMSIKKFNDIAELLTKKYGSPKEDLIDDEPSEGIIDWNEAADEYYDEALQNGKMLIERIWEDDETYLKLVMGNDDGLVFNISYWSQLLYDEYIEERDRALLNDF